MLELTRLWARLVGLSVVAALMVVATQLLTLGFETKPLIATTTLTSLTDWVRRPPLPGPGILLAVVVTAAGLAALVGGLWPRRGPSAIVTRRREGWTRIDRKSLQDAIDRHLEDIDRRSDLKTTVRRSGNVDLKVASIDTSIEGPASKVALALQDLCDQRHLPCKIGTVTVKARSASTDRRRTIQ